MKKLQIFMLAMAVAGTMMLTGCGSKTEESASSDTKAETEEKDSATEETDSETDSETEKTDSATEESSSDTKTTEAAGDSELLTGTYVATITVKDYGTITFEMDADQAPITVTNFVNLAESGFYDGLTFHRIIDGFMIQGGDPLGNGTGGSDETIKGEFSDNGVENTQSHTRGAVSMARSQDYDSASSQFFICQADDTFLDGQYACFGYVTDGMDVVDKICEDTKVEDSNGTVKTENQPVIESITVEKK